MSITWYVKGSFSVQDRAGCVRRGGLLGEGECLRAGLRSSSKARAA